MISGQAPNIETQSDCQSFTNFVAGDADRRRPVHRPGLRLPARRRDDREPARGRGLQLEGLHGGHERARAAVEQPCRHPSIGAQDNTQTAEPNDMYATRHNPFVYFHSIIDFPTCQQNDVDFSHLARRPAVEADDRRTTRSSSPTSATTATTSRARTASPGGLAQADGWLRDHVPQILASPAYRDHGLLMVTFDEAEAPEASPADSDASACCNEQPGPNTPNPGGLSSGPGGGRIGAVLLSPCIEPGTVDPTPYNHYSMLRSFEDLFGLDHLGYAGQDGLVTFSEGSVFSSGPCAAIDLTRKPRKAEVGERTRFRFQVSSVADECVHGVQIRFAGKRAFTDDAGQAKIRTTLKSKRRYRVRATKGGCDPDSVEDQGPRLAPLSAYSAAWGAGRWSATCSPLQHGQRDRLAQSRQHNCRAPTAIRTRASANASS